MMSVDKSDVARKVLEMGAWGKLFQSRDVRAALGITTDGKMGKDNFYNHFRALETECAVEQVPSDRKRNRYFKIADEAVLRSVGSKGRAASVAHANGKLPVAPERLIRIEGAVQDLQQRLAQLEAKVDQLIAVWS